MSLYISLPFPRLNTLLDAPLPTGVSHNASSASPLGYIMLLEITGILGWEMAQKISELALQLRGPVFESPAPMQKVKKAVHGCAPALGADIGRSQVLPGHSVYPEK